MAAAPTTAGAAGAAGVAPGVVAVVVGLGPVGLLAVAAARELGAATVLAVDSVPERLDLARRLGGTPVNREMCDPVAAVQ